MTRKPSKGYLLVHILVISPAMYSASHAVLLFYLREARQSPSICFAFWQRQIVNPEI